MLKNIVQLEVQVGEKQYRFLCDNDAPIGAVKESLFQLNKLVAEIEERIVSANKEAEEAKQAEVPVEV